jgi:hypothetical protein
MLIFVKSKPRNETGTNGQENEQPDILPGHVAGNHCMARRAPV